MSAHWSRSTYIADGRHAVSTSYIPCYHILLHTARNARVIRWLTCECCSGASSDPASQDNITTTLSTMDIVQELEHYLQGNYVDQLLKEMMIQCLRDKPDEPTHYLLKYILQKNASVGSEEVAVASTPDNMHVAISHPDKATQQVDMHNVLACWRLHMLLACAAHALHPMVGVASKLLCATGMNGRRTCACTCCCKSSAVQTQRRTASCST